MHYWGLVRRHNTHTDEEKLRIFVAPICCYLWQIIALFAFTQLAIKRKKNEMK